MEVVDWYLDTAKRLVHLSLEADAWYELYKLLKLASFLFYVYVIVEAAVKPSY